MLEVKVDTKEAINYLTNLGKKDQLDFAISKAINNVMKLIQEAERNDIKAKLKLQRITFNLYGIKIFGWANKDNLSGIIGIDPRLNNLYRLETGEDHVPINGKKMLAVPNVKVFGNKIILSTNPLKPSNLNLHDTPKGTQGDSGTFLVTSKKTGKPVILQRTKKAGSKGKGKKGTDQGTGVRMLYTLVEKRKTGKKLDYYGVARKIVAQSLREEIIKACDYAIQTAKK